MGTTTGKLAALLLVVAGLGGCSGDEAATVPDARREPVVRQLTSNDDVFEANPIFSPDGRWILFESEAAGNRDIWRLPAAGGTAEQLTSDPGFDSSPYWAPDGTRFAFESDRGGSKHIWILAVGTPGATPVPLTSGPWDDGSPSWSPDGSRIIYESNRERGVGTDLWLSPVDGGPALRLTDTPDGTYHRTADWSPDATAVVFESNREDGMPALFTMDVPGGALRRITTLPGYEGHPAWSPDGTRIAFESTASGTMEIHLVAATGGAVSQVTRAGGFWPRWSPDGTAIVYGVYGDPEPNLWWVEME